VINFKLHDTVFAGFTNGEIFKLKVNELIPVNITKDSKEEQRDSESDWTNFQNIFSTDSDMYKPHMNNENLTNFGTYNVKNDINSVENILISLRYKILFGIIKSSPDKSDINIYDLRNNCFIKKFTTIEGIINESKLLDVREIIILIVFNIESKQTTLQIWNYNELSTPLSVFNMSSLFQYSCTINSFNITNIPSKYLGRNSAQGLLDGDFIVLGTTKGDVVLGKIHNVFTSHKTEFQVLYIMNVKNTIKDKEELSNSSQITYIYYDLYFDIMMIGDISSNVRCFEKVLQIGKAQTNEEIIPIFSLFYEANSMLKQNPMKVDFNWDLPLFSVKHDILKDRAIIQYDQGDDIVVQNSDEDDD